MCYSERVRLLAKIKDIRQKQARLSTAFSCCACLLLLRAVDVHATNLCRIVPDSPIVLQTRVAVPSLCHHQSRCPRACVSSRVVAGHVVGAHDDGPEGHTALPAHRGDVRILPLPPPISPPLFPPPPPPTPPRFPSVLVRVCGAQTTGCRRRHARAERTRCAFNTTATLVLVFDSIRHGCVRVCAVCVCVLATWQTKHKHRLAIGYLLIYLRFILVPLVMAVFFAYWLQVT